MSGFQKHALGAVLVLCTWSYAGNSNAGDVTTEEKNPAMAVGGNVSVIYAAPIDEPEKAIFKIRKVELGATVTMSEEITASVVLKTWSSLDSVWVDQALVSLKPAALPMEFLFGQLRFNHGILSTRLISDPLILDSVKNMELKAPGVIFNGTFDHFSGGLGFTVLTKDTFDFQKLDSVTTNLYSGVVNIDVPAPNGSMVRLSTLLYRKYLDVGLACLGNWKTLTFDAEGVTLVNSPDSIKQSGLYAGLRWAASGRFSLALRGDAVSRNNFSTMEQRVAGGAVMSVADNIYAALEFSRGKAPGKRPYQKIAFEIGLRQKLPLPGFQRKTLSRD